MLGLLFAALVWAAINIMQLDLSALLVELPWLPLLECSIVSWEAALMFQNHFRKSSVNLFFVTVFVLYSTISSLRGVGGFDLLGPFYLRRPFD